MDEDLIEAQEATAGQRLRLAREEKSLSLEDIAAQTRIPHRHLESIEEGDWDKLPAPTYTVGFAKSYASVVGLDRNDIGEQLRAEMGGQRPATATETFEPADPARTMPKWLVFGAIAAVVLLVIGLGWWNERSLSEDDSGTAAVPSTVAPPSVAPTPPPVQQAQATASGPVVLTATAPAWIQITDGGQTLFQGELAQGQRYEVPTTATAPTLRAGAPEALQITVGGNSAPAVGEAGRVASNVSLKAEDLMRGPQANAPTATPAAAR